MDILLIGNGFDLEHKLPTTYRDFLMFCDAVFSIANATNYQLAFLTLTNLFDVWNPPQQVQQKLFGALNCCSDSEFPNSADYTTYNIVNRIYPCIQNNLWFSYFKKRLNSLGNNWIDFEKEISHVIQILESAYVFFTKDPYSTLPDNLAYPIIDIARDFDKPSTATMNGVSPLLSFRDDLSLDLDRFIHALELFLTAFIGEIPIPNKNISKNIKQLFPDKVLSFNYTNTYARTLGRTRNIDYCYIHGKANLTHSIDSCNMVLGIDEYLTDERKNSDLEFLHFKKYYQRIYKSTDNKYLDWIDDIHNFSETTHKLYIFGHSLDVTDKDVLHQLICNDNVQTKIFYYRKSEHDKSVLGQLIRNLVRIIGQDELIRRTGGSHRTIEFIPQTLRE